MARRRICYVVSSPLTVASFLAPHVAAATDWDVAIVANTRDPDLLRKLGLHAQLHRVPLERKISPWRDAAVLLALIRLFRTGHFDVVHSISPKAGLLAMLAAWLTGVRHRIHTFTGQVWVTQRGWRREVLKQVDRLLAGLAERVLVDSPSQRDFLIVEGVVDAEKSEVIGNGSICGVDGTRFRSDLQVRCSLRAELGIPETAQVLLFLGRLNRDKGIADLAMAFASVARQFPEAWLLLVGPDEECMMNQVCATCAAVAGRIRYVEYTPVPEQFMAAADIFCLPSYREGFGMAVIEAAAVGLPAVASRIYGLTDAVVDGETGLLHPPGDVPALAEALTKLLTDATVRMRMGEAARVRALTEFPQQRLTQGLMAFYGKMTD